MVLFWKKLVMSMFWILQRVNLVNCTHTLLCFAEWMISVLVPILIPKHTLGRTYLVRKLLSSLTILLLNTANNSHLSGSSVFWYFCNVWEQNWKWEEWNPFSTLLDYETHFPFANWISTHLTQNFYCSQTNMEF